MTRRQFLAAVVALPAAVTSCVPEPVTPALPAIVPNCLCLPKHFFKRGAPYSAHIREYEVLRFNGNEAAVYFPEDKENQGREHLRKRYLVVKRDGIWKHAT